MQTCYRPRRRRLEPMQPYRENPSSTGVDLPAACGGTPVRSADNPLIFGRPYVGEAEIAEVSACLRGRWIGPGERTERFERAFAEYKGTPYAIAVNSGTAAIQLALFAVGVRPGDEVIAPTMTFCPSLHPIILAGATPVLVDCLPETGNIDPEALERHVTPKTKALLVVHMCGRCCDMEPILRVARRHRLKVIEDCAHAIEAGYHGQASGSIGDVGCFSFYATKNLTTGDGGMVTTPHERLYRRMNRMVQQGVSAGAWERFVCGESSYKVIAPGYRCKMNDIAASLGLMQLQTLGLRWKQRERLWHAYDGALKGLPLVLPPSPEPDTVHAYHLYTPLLKLEELTVSRAAIIAAVRRENITLGVHYIPAHNQPYYRSRYHLKRQGFPNASLIGDRTISLPLSCELSLQDVADVSTALRRVLRHYSIPEADRALRAVPDRSHQHATVPS